MVAGVHKAKNTKKQRKFGRNATFCNMYRNTNRRERNKIIRLRRHLVRFPGDNAAKTAVDRCKVTIGIR